MRCFCSVCNNQAPAENRRQDKQTQEINERTEEVVIIYRGIHGLFYTSVGEGLLAIYRRYQVAKAGKDEWLQIYKGSILTAQVQQQA